ncbi:hypothetical protein OG884_15605 [Streptosporangium sp. NBC_01755]|uniref:hypothetical protein n=1 Tax=Streptosporangium sp. NBC_01755 TaxID=2975949 RepID=UPI002DDBAC1C|nr:hypothetical protein [Streptosporangium sp. NBC_01755]WSD03260.1 hypothetical protein OG884_15605 [Streptosporangium sp. NBC_01755]
MYLVITYNQASHQPELGSWSLYTDLDDAQAERDDQQAQTDAVGRRDRHVVAEVTPIESEDDR